MIQVVFTSRIFSSIKNYIAKQLSTIVTNNITISEIISMHLQSTAIFRLDNDFDFLIRLIVYQILQVNFFIFKPFF